MQSAKKAMGYGFLTWLLPFVASFVLFPLKKAGDPLFETSMALVLATCGVVFVSLYFQSVHGDFLKEGILVGGLWMAINWALDLCLFMQGPMRMTFSAYMKDIGLMYLMSPILSVGAGR